MEIFSADCVFEIETREFVFSAERFEVDVVVDADIVFLFFEYSVNKGFVAEELVEQSADVHGLAVACEQKRILQCGVGVADNRNVFVFVKRSVAQRAVTHAVADQFFFAGHADFTVFDARRDDDGEAFVFAVIGDHLEPERSFFYFLRLFEFDLRAPCKNLFIQFVHEFAACRLLDGGEVFHAGRKSYLSAEVFGFQHENAFAVTQTVECGGHSRRTCSDDYNIYHNYSSYTTCFCG